MAKRPARSVKPRRPSRAARKTISASRSAHLLDLGALRWGLFLLTLFLIVFAAPAGSQPGETGWSVFSALIMPALSPLVLMILLLDALMSTVFLKGTHQAAQRPRYRLSLSLNLVLVVALVIAWYPFFSRALLPA